MILIEDHKKNLERFACMVSGQKPAQWHHAMGGSLLTRVGARGTKKHSDFLIIPLHYDFHQGQCGIHTIGVKRWETAYGTQVAFLDQLCEWLNYDVWSLALADKQQQKERRQRRMGSTKLIKHPGHL